MVRPHVSGDRGSPRRPAIVVVLGPTAAGKTGLGLDLAEGLGGEIVGADSIQIYRHLDIGSAKPTPAERARVPHHLVDFLDPAEPYNAADYLRDAAAVIADLDARGKVAVVVGGTALYLRALLYGLSESPAADPSLRAELAARAEAEGWPALHEELGRVDPAAAARIHPHDRVRIERALEVTLTSGEPISAQQSRHGFAAPRWRAYRVGVDVPRAVLVERIDRRVGEMVEEGWFEEVEALLARGYDPGLKPLQAIGYRDIVACLRGEIDRDEAVRRIRRDTRRFAKRQLTWFRKEPDVHWVAPGAGGAGHAPAAALLPAIRRFLAGTE